MVFPGMLTIDDAVWSAVMKAASYRCGLAAPFHGSSQLCARYFGGINYEERACARDLPIMKFRSGPMARAPAAAAQASNECGANWRATADEDGHYCFAMAL
jgi:hypothetical protein